MDRPKVSVCMIVYNQEKYVAQAINSILSQKHSFEIELIISNDASTDNSHQIISEISSASENTVIKYYNHSKNKGMMPNFIWALNKCAGEYIALCEGDDYWSESFKLQTQVDFMDSNRDCALCFHNVDVYIQNKQTLVEDMITRDVPDLTDINELSKGNYIHTPSVLLRNDFSLPKWFKRSHTGDWVLYMLMIGNRKIKKFSQKMAVYREHKSGVWSGVDTKVKAKMTLHSFQLVYDNLNMDDGAKENLKREIQRLNKYLGIKSEPKQSSKSKVKAMLRPLYRLIFRG